MEYFADLDVSMSETHVCVVTQDGAVIHEERAPSTPGGIQGLGIRDRQTIDDAQGADRARPSSRHHHACHAATRAPGLNRRSRAALAGQEVEPSSRAERRLREGTDDDANSVAAVIGRLRFNRGALYRAEPIKCHTSTERTQTPRQRRYRAQPSQRDPSFQHSRPHLGPR